MEQNKLMRTDVERMAALRRKFLDQAMSYVGTPYARKYHEPNCELVNLCFQ